VRSRNLLLLSASTNLLYLLTEGDYRDIPILSGSVSPSPAFERFTELTSGQILYAPPSQVSPHGVPDDQVHEVLRVNGVDGLRPVVALSLPSPGDEKALKYSGNLADPTWMFICVSGTCNSKCLFCYTEWIRDKPGLSSPLIKQAIERATHIPSLRTVVFSGGEPTLREDLADLMSHAKTQGFSDIGIYSNGYRLANAKYLEKLRDAGLTTVLLSLHGSNRDTHDSITGLHGSFDRAVRALALLEEAQMRTTVNFVVCAANSSELPEFTSVVKQTSASARIRFSFPVIEGEAYRNANDLLPSFPEFVCSVTAALAQDPQLRSRTEIANVPPCISGQLRLNPKYLVSQRRSFMDVSPFDEHDVDRGEQLVKLQKCRKCSWWGDCGGVQIPYLTRFANAQEHLVPDRSARVG
jgi:MoaA/NifB/PqqE/SkfB family radical SAM enzyme